MGMTLVAAITGPHVPITSCTREREDDTDQDVGILYSSVMRTDVTPSTSREHKRERSLHIADAPDIDSRYNVISKSTTGPTNQTVVTPEKADTYWANSKIDTQSPHQRGHVER